MASNALIDGKCLLLIFTQYVLWVLYGRINVATSCKINEKFKQVRIKTAGALSDSLPLNLNSHFLSSHILPPRRLRNKRTNNYPGTVIHFFSGFLVLTLGSVEVFTWHDTLVLSLVFELCSFSFLKRLVRFETPDNRDDEWSTFVNSPSTSLPAHTDCSHVWVPHSLIETRLVLSSVRRFIVFVVAIAGCPPCHIRHWVRCL